MRTNLSRKPKFLKISAIKHKIIFLGHKITILFGFKIVRLRKKVRNFACNNHKTYHYVVYC